MASHDLEALSLKELKQLQKDLAKAISTYEDRQKAEARAKVEAVVREMGISLAELVAGSDGNPAARLPHRGTRKTWPSPCQAAGASRSGSWKL